MPNEPIQLSEDIKEKILDAIIDNVNGPGLAFAIIDNIAEPAIRAAVAATDTKLDDAILAALYQNLEDALKAYAQQVWNQLK